MQKTRKIAEPLCLREDRMASLPSQLTRMLTLLQGLQKEIPEQPKNVTPVHLRDIQLYADQPKVLHRNEKDVGILK